MTHATPQQTNRAAVPLAIVGIAVAYLVALFIGWPQLGTQYIVEAQSHHVVADEAAPNEAAHSPALASAPPFWTVFPFALLLGAIAVLPLIPATSHWWEHNSSKLLVASALGLVTLAYYAFLHRSTLEAHWPAHHVVEPAVGALQPGFVNTILSNAILQEFIPFIILLFSLYTISGGIRITGDLRADPLTNASFMAVGAVLANFIGTTGAAMLLVRPLLETNKERKNIAHTVVFFIFIVCNCGGCLTPLGDPPLFLGYLEGVPFAWTLQLWREWLFVNGLLLVIYIMLDEFVFYRKETTRDIVRDIENVSRLQISGWKLNAPLLLGIILAVAFLDPSKAFPSTEWHPWMYLRELVQLSLVAISLGLGNPAVREQNHFNYSAIIEVAALFIGIFICMQPALQILSVYGNKLGLQDAPHFFWATGSLSSVLDNAPTYLVFFKAAQSMAAEPGVTLVAGVQEHLLRGVSLGAVFMGAMTYIGNGPNFMVRSIAENSGVKMPSFFGYMFYSLTILLPLFALMVWQFLM